MTANSAEPNKSSGGYLRATGRIILVTLGSRILGLARDVLMFQTLGFGWAMGTFAMAWMIPNMLRRLFGEGALSASFIPEYTRLNEYDALAGRRLLGSVTGFLLLLLGTVSALVIIAALVIPGEWVGRVSQQGNGLVDAQQQGELLLDLTVILFPYAIPICLTAIFAGALNAHGVFGLPAAAPVVLNLFWIGGLALALALDIQDHAQIVTLVAVCLSAGGIAQVSILLIPLWRRRLLETPRLPRAGDPGRQVVRAMGPAAIGMSLVQINTLMDTGFAYWFFGAAGPSFIYAANRLLLFPHALTGLALATAIFPQLAKLGGSNDRSGLRKRLDEATHHTLLVAIPAAVGVMLVAQPLIALIFASDRSTADDLATANLTTIYLVASLPAIGVAQLHTRALYALNDYKTPAWMSFWLLMFNLVLNITLVVILDLGVPGLALATTIASIANVFALRRKTIAVCPGKTHDFRIWQTLLATGCMALAVFVIQGSIDAASMWDQALFDLALPIVAGITIYGSVQYLLGQRSLRLR